MKQLKLRLLYALLLTIAIQNLWGQTFSAANDEGKTIYYSKSSENTVSVTYNGKYNSNVPTYTGDIVIPSTVEYNGTIYTVTGIGDYTFYRDSITSIVLPNTITSIGDNGVNACHNTIKSVRIASIEQWCKISFSKYSSSPFYSSREASLYIGDDDTPTTELVIPSTVESIPAYAFYDCSSFASVDMPNVTSIGDDAFFNCSSLASVDMSNVTSIDGSAFNACISLASVDMPNVTSIDGSAFNACISLASVNMPNVTSIGDVAFQNCLSLTSVDMPNVTNIGYSAFYCCSSLASVDMPNVTSIDEWVFCQCSSLASVDMPNVTSTSKGAFYRCSSLASVDMPNVTSIDNYAFQNCSSLASVDMPNVTSIRNEAFCGCSALTSVDIPNVTSIRNEAFSDCISLTSVDIPNVTSIGNVAFNACISLASVNMPNVTSIGNYAFGDCNSLKEIISLNTNPPTTDDGIFYDVPTNDCIVKVPASAIEPYRAADGWKDFENIVAYEPETPDNYLYVNDLRVKTGTSVQIPVCMASEEENIVGFQCEIALSEGMEFAKNAQGQCILTWNKDRADDHTFSTKMLDNGVVRIVAKSNNLYEFYDTDGELFYINATVSDDMADGEYEMTLSDVRLSTNDLVEIKCPEVKAAVSVYSYTYGDLNDDGEWSIIDVTMELRNMLENIYMPAGDMNDDGQITIIDLTRVIQCVLDKGLPATYAPRQQAAAVGGEQERVVVGNIVLALCGGASRRAEGLQGRGHGG